MSLTSLLRDPVVRRRFGQEFVKPKLEASTPILAPPRSNRYSLVGTAFDYLLRFTLEANSSKVVSRDWIAEGALGKINPFQDWKTFRRAGDMLDNARNQHARYLRTGAVTNSLLLSTLDLAHLDFVSRMGDVLPDFGKNHTSDTQDLHQLLRVVPLRQLRPKKVAVLNPNFGWASEAMGGADCDLIVDNTLIEIKTTKNFVLDREHFNQLLGYYTLYLCERPEGLPESHELSHLGVYFSRHGYLFRFTVEEVINSKRFVRFVKWLLIQADKARKSNIEEMTRLPFD